MKTTRKYQRATPRREWRASAISPSIKIRATNPRLLVAPTLVSREQWEQVKAAKVRRETQILAGVLQERVHSAVANPKWDFRTAEGVAKETGLPREAVEKILEQDPEVRRSRVLDPQGQRLYTLRSHPVSAREILATLRMYVKNTV